MNESFFPTKEKFINPYTDEGFKRIFGSEINKDMIIKFLNSLLNETIRDITFRNVEAFGLGRNDRKAVFDIFCKTDKEEMIIVETEVYLEMPKFTLKLSDCDTLYKKFLFVLNNIDILERLPKELNEQIFQKLKSIVEIERMTPDERLAYELSLSTKRDLYACMETKYEEGMEKGKAEGKVEGKVEVAGKMKSRGIPVETIAQCTGLSVEEIGSL